MKVIITRNAEDDLESVFHYHAEYNLDYALEFHDQIVRFLLETLSRFPELGREYRSETGIRKLVYVQHYNIYYQIQDNAVYILYILDGRRLLNSSDHMLDDDDLNDITR